MRSHQKRLTTLFVSLIYFVVNQQTLGDGRAAERPIDERQYFVDALYQRKHHTGGGCGGGYKLLLLLLLMLLCAQSFEFVGHVRVECPGQAPPHLPALYKLGGFHTGGGVAAKQLREGFDGCLAAQHSRVPFNPGAPAGRGTLVQHARDKLSLSTLTN